LAPLAIVTLTFLTACNPTWTKDGKPNDASMPMPPGATPPTNAAGGGGSQPAAQRP
jgi:hypothetical protein